MKGVTCEEGLFVIVSIGLSSATTGHEPETGDKDLFTVRCQAAATRLPRLDGICTHE